MMISISNQTAKISLIILFIIASGFIFPAANEIVQAKITYDELLQSVGDTGLPGAPASTVSELVQIVDTVLVITYWVTLCLAILFIIFAAFNYLTAAGDTEKVKTAHKQIMYAVIAIAITLVAIGAVNIVGDLIKPGWSPGPSPY